MRIRNAILAAAIMGLVGVVYGQGHDLHAKTAKTQPQAMDCCKGMASKKAPSDGCCADMMGAKGMKAAPMTAQTELLEMLRTENEKLTTVLAEMNGAPQDQKLDAAIKSINQLADQHRKMEAMVVGYITAQNAVRTGSKTVKKAR